MLGGFMVVRDAIDVDGHGGCVAINAARELDTKGVDSLRMVLLLAILTSIYSLGS